MMLRAPGAAFRIMSYLSLPFSISPERGARISVYLASSPDLEGVSGAYFTRSRLTEARNRFDTDENRAVLWDLSLESLRERTAVDARSGG